MGNNKCKVGFIGDGDWGSYIVSALLQNSSFQVTSILTQGSILAKIDKKQYENIPYKIFSISSDYRWLLTFSNDIIFVAGWPFKIPIDEFDLPNKNIFLNFHASLLPKYRGPEPLIRQLLNGETRGGVTLHKIEKNFDTGLICFQKEFSIVHSDNNKTLFIKACRSVMKMLYEFGSAFGQNSLEFIPQYTLGESSYYPKLKISDCIIDSKMLKEDVIKMCKAFYGQYPLIIKNNQKYFTITEFEFTDESDSVNQYFPLANGYMKLTRIVPLNFSVNL